MKLYIWFNCDGDGGMAIVPAEDEIAAKKRLEEDVEIEMYLPDEEYVLDGSPIYYNPYET